LSEERLQKILAAAGLASRRGAARLIMEGRVLVDGIPAQTPGQRIDPSSVVTLDGLEIGASEQKIYLMLHKPAGYVTTLSDPQGRPAIKDLLGGVRQRVFPVGRLDRDVSGLLILTNDGELAKRLMHPSFMIPKVYRAKVEGRPGREFIETLRSGRIVIEGRPAAPAKARMLRSGPDAGCLELVLTEGRNRQVKRMCAAAGHPVEVLRRVAYCGIELPSNLPPGKHQRLSPEEVAMLKKSVGLASSSAQAKGPSRSKAKDESFGPSKAKDESLEAERPKPRPERSRK
jgi:pseudouridine synthase